MKRITWIAIVAVLTLLMPSDAATPVYNGSVTIPSGDVLTLNELTASNCVGTNSSKVAASNTSCIASITAGSNITVSTGAAPTVAVTAAPNFTGGVTANGISVGATTGNYIIAPSNAQLVIDSNAATGGIVYLNYNNANQTSGARVYDGGTGNYLWLKYNTICLTSNTMCMDYGSTTPSVLTIPGATAFTNATAPVMSSPLLAASGGTGAGYGNGTALTAATSGINTTDTVLATLPLGSGNSLAAGTSFDFKAFGSNTATTGTNSTFTVRFGTAGTTADATIGSIVVGPSQNNGTSIPFSVDMTITIRTIGSSTSATEYGYINVLSGTGNSTTGGIIGTAYQVSALTASAFNSSISSGILSVSYKTGATTDTSTFQNAQIVLTHP